MTDKATLARSRAVWARAPIKACRSTTPFPCAFCAEPIHYGQAHHVLNARERAHVRCVTGTALTVAPLPHAAAPPAPYQEPLTASERATIEQYLASHESNKPHAAAGTGLDAGASESLAEAHEDLRAILRALGLFDGARPESPHAVVVNVVLPAIASLRAAVLVAAAREDT